MNRTFVVVGDETLTVECIRQLIDAGQAVELVITRSAMVREFADAAGIAHRAGLKEPVPTCDYVLSVANLRMLPDSLLTAPRIAAINFHDGPLPVFAGLNAPVWAILEGASSYGVTWHLMTSEPDAGDILEQELFELDESETAVSLNTRCFDAGLASFTRLLPQLIRAELTPRAQDLSQRTYFGLGAVPPGSGVVDPRESFASISRLVRALDFGDYPNPIGSAWLATERGAVRVAGVRQERGRAASASCGTILEASGTELSIELGDGLAVFETQDSSGNTLSAHDAIAMLGLHVGGRLAPTSDWLDMATQLARLAAVVESAASVAAATEGPELPFLRNDSPGDWRYSPGPILAGLPAVAPEAALEALGRFVAALTGEDAVVHVATAERARQTADHRGLFDPFLPIRFAKHDAPEVALARVRRSMASGPISADMMRRGAARSTASSGDRIGISFGPCVSGPYDLQLCCPEEGLSHWHYRESRLSMEDALTFAEAFGAFASQAAQQEGDPQTLPHRQSELLAGWNTTAVDFDRSMTIVSAFEAMVDETPEKVAVTGGGLSLTYLELDRRANRLAHKLVTLGAGPDSLVAVHMGRSLDLLVALLGVLKAGAAYVPVDPEYPAARKSLMIEDSGARLVISDRRLSLGESQARVLGMSEAELSLDESRPVLRSAPENLAYVIYTSGSTGRPKGVMLEHRNVINFFRGMDDRVGIEPGTWLAVTSISFDISVLELLWTLTRGFEVVLNGARTSKPHETPSLSVFFFGSDPGSPEGSYDLMFDAAKFADAHGFEAVWTPERHFHAFGGAFPNPSVTSAALAAVTTRLAIRAGSCVLPLHTPIRVAEEWALVDQISNGRVGISFATGWQPNDFVINPGGYGGGKSALLEDIGKVHALWRGEALSFPGHDGAPVSVRTLPRPVQAALPTWLTSAGDVETFRLAGARGFNILTHLLGQSITELAEKVAAYRDARRQAGHAGSGQVTLMLHSYVSDSDDDARETVREPMISYLRSSVGLIKQFATSFPTFKGSSADQGDLLANLSPSELRELLEVAFERYYETSGLFGDTHRASAMLRDVKLAGVDEVACLVDFGVEHARVLASLERIAALREREIETEPPSIGGLMQSHRVTHFQCTPSMAAVLASDPEFLSAASGLKVMMVGGEAFPLDLATNLASQVGGRLLNMYGPTETTIWSTTSEVSAGASAVSIGTPIANTSIYILGADRQLLPPGAVGELWIGGEGVARGYLNRPELTAERFVPDPFSNVPGSRMYRTGDLARFESDGTITFLGRVDQQVKVRGYRIEPGEIETLVRAHDGIMDAVVVAREDTPGDQRLVCYYVSRTDLPVDIQSLRDEIGRQLPSYMVPTNFVSMASLPLTPNKKVDRKALPLPGENPTRDASPAANVELRTPVSGQALTLVTRYWEEVLKTSELPTNRTFFDCGGNSLLLLQLHKKLVPHRADLRLTDLFRHPTIESLASYLGDNTDSTHVADDASQRALARRSALAGRRPVRV